MKASWLKRVWILGGILGVLGVGAGLSLPSWLQWRKNQERQARMALQGKPWNGGKPTAPIELEASLEGEIPAGDWVDVSLAILPTTEGCTSLTSRARGLDGVEVSDDSLWTHPSCAQGERVIRELRVRAAEGVSGLLVMDLRMEMSSGEAFEVSRVVPFRAEGTPVLPQKAESN